MRSTEGMCLSDDVNFPRRYAVSANAHDSVSVTLNFCVLVMAAESCSGCHAVVLNPSWGHVTFQGSIYNWGGAAELATLLTSVNKCDKCE